MKKLVIISGVTGAIGSALLAEYAQDENTIIYGISRKALPIENFTLPNSKLPLSTLICSIPDVDLVGYTPLIERINFGSIEHVIYIHAMGFYPFEVNRQGEILIQNDYDLDGIDDRVTKLTLNTFTDATQALIESYSGKVSCILFGGLADKHKPSAHSSWWKTIKKTKEYMKSSANGRVSMVIFNISSVICPHEIIIRPYVFSQTDADQRYWLLPHELAQFVISEASRSNGGFRELEKFRIRPGFDPEYYTDAKFTPRKIAELYPAK